MNFSTIDIITFALFAVVVVGYGLWIGRNESKHHETARDYFLAGSSIPWWAVGGSLIASNISAEQFIGMSGSGYVVGMAVASYELMAAATLLLIAKYFIPIFIKKEIYTMPQFLEARFDRRVRSGLAIFWVILFVFVNISTVLYLGAKALEITGLPLIWGIIGLALYSAATSVLGGLKAVVWTEVAQLVILLVGGLATAYLSLDAVSGGNGFFAGVKTLTEQAPEKFDLILSKDNPEYQNYPGISVLIGGMWIANLYYWGMNQYIIQRALAARDVSSAQHGIAFAAILKVLMPVIVVLPGIAAFALHAPITKPDEAYPWVMNTYVFAGLKGLAFAALTAAVGSSVSAIINSASTIFTLDIYKTLINTEANEDRLVKVGKISALAALLIGVLIAPTLASLGQVYQFIQQYTGYISPGVVTIFLFGLFWRKTSTDAALAVVLLSIPLSAGLDYGCPWLPFMNRMGLSFLFLSVITIAISFAQNKNQDDYKAIDYGTHLFKTDWIFNTAALFVIGMLCVIYYVWW